MGGKRHEGFQIVKLSGKVRSIPVAETFACWLCPKFNPRQMDAKVFLPQHFRNSASFPPGRQPASISSTISWTSHLPIMPPRTGLATPLRAWTCPQCTIRTFASTAKQQQVGPEHPQYIPIPEPPQQTTPSRPFIKGRLPVPRDVFSGAEGKDKSSDEWLKKHTRSPRKPSQAKENSRDQWKDKMSEMRRQNLREGLVSLRVRKDRVERQLAQRAARNKAEREEMLNRPEREDERLTAPSHGLDLETLYKGPLSDPTREERLKHMRANIAQQAELKKAERLDHLHTLYLNARSFIVTPQQLDAAVDEAFGTPENPVTFGAGFGEEHGTSVWSSGRPERVQDLLDRANKQVSKSAFDNSKGTIGINRERIARIAEVLTGGKMDDGENVRR